MTDDQAELETYVREDLPRIVKLVQKSRVKELQISGIGQELTIRRATETAVRLGPETSTVGVGAVESVEAGPHVRTIPAPMVGVFYHAEQPGRAPLVHEGSHVDRGSLIGVIEALQVLTEVESDTTGTVQRVVAADGQPVEYGQPLVEVLVEA